MHNVGVKKSLRRRSTFTVGHHWAYGIGRLSTPCGVCYIVQRVYQDSTRILFHPHCARGRGSRPPCVCGVEDGCCSRINGKTSLPSVFVHLVGVLYLPLSRLAAKLQLQVGGVQAERPDVVEGGDRVDLALDVHKFSELSLFEGKLMGDQVLEEQKHWVNDMLSRGSSGGGQGLEEQKALDE